MHTSKPGAITEVFGSEGNGFKQTNHSACGPCRIEDVPFLERCAVGLSSKNLAVLCCHDELKFGFSFIQKRLVSDFLTLKAHSHLQHCGSIFETLFVNKLVIFYWMYCMKSSPLKFKSLCINVIH